MTDTLRADLATRLAAIARRLGAERPRTAERKAHQDYVTEVDHLADDLVSSALEDLAPGVPVYSEERPWPDDLPDTFWIVDPIDGTGNLVAGLPFVATAVALREDGRTSVACIASLSSGEAFSAADGRGAYLGETRLTAPAGPSDLVAVSSGVLDISRHCPGAYGKIRTFGKIRNLGSQALQLAYVASGRLSGALSQEARLWDDVAGALTVREAGMVYAARPVSDSADAEQRSYACHPALRDQFEDVARELWETRAAAEGDGR